MSQHCLTKDPGTEPGDPVDRLLSDFFRTQLPDPWPAAPGAVMAEPSSLIATSSVSVPCSQPTSRDGIRKSRYTLAALVVLFLGTCWSLSSGFQPTSQTRNAVGPGGMLPGAEASKPVPVIEIRKDRAIQGTNEKSRPAIELP
jgi:hypothetical protein